MKFLKSTSRNLRSFILLACLCLSPAQTQAKFFKSCRSFIAKLFPPSPSILPKAGEGNFQIVGGGRPLSTYFPDAARDVNYRGEDYIAPAWHYKILFTHNGVPVSVPLIVPVEVKDEIPLLNYQEKLQPTKVFNKIRHALKQLPGELLQKVGAIYLNPTIKEKDKGQKKWTLTGAHIEQSADSDKLAIITVFPPAMTSSKSTITGYLRHELGHIVALSFYDDFAPGGDWLEAMQLDNVRVSWYGETSPEEDFAEAVRVYLKSEGGLKNSLYRIKFIHRFALLDDILKVDRNLKFLASGR